MSLEYVLQMCQLGRGEFAVGVSDIEKQGARRKVQRIDLGAGLGPTLLRSRHTGGKKRADRVDQHAITAYEGPYAPEKGESPTSPEQRAPPRSEDQWNRAHRSYDEHLWQSRVRQHHLPQPCTLFWTVFWTEAYLWPSHSHPREDTELRTESAPLAGLLLACIMSTPIAAQDLDMPRPIEGINTVWIEEMTWLDVREALAEGKTTAIVPTGGVEQNGPYVAAGKHNFVLSVTAEAIARELGNALVAPIVKFVPEGDIDEPSGHMRYHATLSVREDTFAALLTDIVGSLAAHGFTDIVLIGDSGGNVSGMQTTTDRLNERWMGRPARVYHIPEYYREDMYSCDYLKAELGIFQEPDNCVATRNDFHDDYHYSSIIATTDPTRIRAQQRMDRGLFSINGVDLVPLERTISNGRRLVRYRAEITARAIRAAIGEN